MFSMLKACSEGILHTSLLVGSQIQNLGYFPVRNLQLNIEIPEMTKNGNHILQISDFHVDQVSVRHQRFSHMGNIEALNDTVKSYFTLIWDCLPAAIKIYLQALLTFLNYGGKHRYHRSYDLKICSIHDKQSPNDAFENNVSLINLQYTNSVLPSPAKQRGIDPGPCCE